MTNPLLSFLKEIIWFFFAGGLLADIAEIRRFYRGGGAEIIFFYKSGIDEQWLGSTAKATKTQIPSAVVINSRKALAHQHKDSNVFLLSIFSIVFLRCRVFVSTSTLAFYLIPPRTKHIVNMPHSLVSLHVIYDKNAFNGYNVFFCCGKHHIEEINALDKFAHRKLRSAIPVGYGKFDYLIAKYEAFKEATRVNTQSKKHILLAPSWGGGNILDTIGQELISGLLANGYRVTVRPHPMQLNSPKVKALTELNFGNRNFSLEDPNQEQLSLFAADLMISDYSGVAYEYAFLRERPVIFLDMPHKVGNPHWEHLGIAPIELAFRNRIGEVLAMDDIDAISLAVSHVLSNVGDYRDGIIAARKDLVFNYGNCSRSAVHVLQTLVSKGCN